MGHPGATAPAGPLGGRGRPCVHSRRAIVNAILYLDRTGCAWRYLPKDFPPWQTVYGYFAAWRDDGTLQRIHDQLREAARTAAGRNITPTAAVIDSQSVRAADTVPKASRGWDQAKKVNGRKRHVVVDTAGRCWRSWSPRPACKTATARSRCWNSRRAFPVVQLRGPTAVTPGKLVTWAATSCGSPCRSSAPMTCTPSRSCPDAGSSSAPSPGPLPSAGPRLRTPPRQPKP